jgi:acyl-CoA reductase-like NAD-dependent aldehyde dehydrogenase
MVQFNHHTQQIVRCTDQGESKWHLIRTVRLWINGWAALADQFEEGGFKQSGQGRMRGLAVIATLSSTSTLRFVQVSTSPNGLEM